MNDDRLRESLHELELPDQRAAEERSWRIVQAAHAERRGRPQGLRRPARLPARLALSAAALGALILGLALTPAGAAVRDWVADAIDEGPQAKPRPLTELPAPGELLVASPPGVWLVREDGTRRLLGDYEEAAFSPRGLNVAAVGDGQLVAVNPLGELRWSFPSERPLADPRWAPSGFRVAFRNGEGLDVIAGDGTAPRRLAARVAALAPSWRPSPAGVDPRYAPNVLTYVDRHRRVTTVDVDSGARLWRTRVEPDAGPITAVEWVDSDRVVVATREEVSLLDGDGRPQRAVPLPARSSVASLAASPDGEQLAIVLGPAPGSLAARSRLLLARIDGGEHRERTIFSGLGRFGAPVFSPDGKWILLPWADTDQWLFLSPSSERKLLRTTIAVTGVARQFDPGGRGAATFPAVASWCCG